jgi:UDP-N-acetylglucosamine pyrophosphorylase
MKNEIEKVIKNGDSFEITFYPQNMNYDVDEHQVQSTTRFAKWDNDCGFISKPKTKNASPYIKFFDVKNDQYRNATTMYRAVSIFLNNKNYTWKVY